MCGKVKGILNYYSLHSFGSLLNTCLRPMAIYYMQRIVYNRFVNHHYLINVKDLVITTICLCL